MRHQTKLDRIRGTKLTCVLCDRRGATGFDRFGEDCGAIGGKCGCEGTTKRMDRSPAAARGRMRLR